LSNLNLGLIGNCQISALIDDKATIVWSCLPQLDADPTFCRLLRADGEESLPGYFEIEMLDFDRSEQEYLTNTAILVTTLYDSNGGAVRITDLAPRYEQLAAYRAIEAQSTAWMKGCQYAEAFVRLGTEAAGFRGPAGFGP